MKRKVSKLRLSPNEEARIIREEHERRRKLRIQQVREQQRYIALHIRQEVEQRRQQELQHLEEELRKDWEQQQQEKLQTVQTLYQESLQLLGQGHRSAKENEPDLAAIAQKEEENHIKAEERYREALKELKSQRLKDHERHTQSISARKKALQAEKERSAKVARLPPPPPDPIQCIYPKKQHVKRSDVSAFAVSRYHMPENTVNRVEDTNQPNAHEEAELEVRRLRDLEMEETRRREEQLEKARVRGRQALRREQLVQDRERLLVELEHMQQTDLLRRRQQVSQMPPQIFQPLYKRQEVREDFQREMEFAFEDMYTGERRVKGDLVVRLVPEPLPAFSTGSQDQQLDITMEEIATSEMENTQDDSQRESGATEQETSAEAEPSRPPPRRALKKLLDRIRSQRDQWPDHSCRVPVADSPTTITDQIPERDTSIETGSLTSEEKDKQTPTDLGEPAHSPPALESAEPSPAADSLLPDVLSYKIQEFEEERKKREEKLEEEKRQQVFLLQELEEQKAKLEQMLLEDQQEREDLKAAVTQEIPVHQLEEPARDQEVTSVNVNAGEDDHTRRIRQYQQRLLDQNRIHQRSVEVARHRLAEYQRALQIRYNMAASSLPPVVVPPNVVQPPLQRPPPVQLPPPLRLPTTPVVPVNTQVEPQIAVNVTDTLASLSNVPGFTLSSKLPLHQVESVSSSTMNPRRAVTSWLTDSIMERVTQHLPERMRPSSVTKETPLHKACTTHHASSIPPQPDPVQAFSPSTTDRTPVPSGHAVVNKDTPPQEHLQTEYLSSTEATLERQRRELQEAKRRVSRQREALLLQQRLQEEERQRQEAEMEQIRRQKETLQAPIDTDEQPVSETAGEVLTAENTGQYRLRLLASLLRAIEESNGGTLSHLEDSEKDEDPPQLLPNSDGTASTALIGVPAGPPATSVPPSGLLHPLHAAKPPVTRVRLGLMTEQHELSAIQEVETPVNTSQVTGPEDPVAVTSHSAGWDPQEESVPSVTSDLTLYPPDDRTSSSDESSHLIWRERLLVGAGTSPESSDSGLRRISALSSDSGRGADFSGPAATSNRSPSKSPHRPAESDCLSSTTISTGSYVTTDPEQIVNSDEVQLEHKSPALKHSLYEESRADLHVSSPPGQSFEDSSAAGPPAVTVDSLFNDSSIQRIIDRYTQELNLSLSTCGKTTDSEGSYVEDPGPSVSQQSLVQVSESRGEVEASTGSPSPQSGPEWDSAVSPALQHFSGEGRSLAEDSFHPLIGQLADQSSCLTQADHRDSVLEQLVGHPTAQSSMICHLPGPPVSLSVGQGGWDSTLTRMIGRLSRRSSSHWLSGGQDFHAGQLMGQVTSEPSTTWLDEAQEGSRMNPLVGEPDESAGQHSGSLGGRSHGTLGVMAEASVPSYMALPPEASSHSTSPVNAPQEQTQQNQTAPMDLDSERAEGSDSFLPLQAELTHNETVDPTLTFHLPENSEPHSPVGSAASSEPEVETQTDPSVESELLSPEHFRSEKPDRHKTASPALHKSFSQLVTSWCHPQDSVLTVSPPLKTDVEQTALILSNLTVCDEMPALSVSQPEGAERPRASVQFEDICAKQLESECSDLWSGVPGLQEAAGEKGILEQSEVTQVSLTDTTLQDQETTITEEVTGCKDKRSEGLTEDGQESRETDGSESVLLSEKTAEVDSRTHPAGVLEFQWGPTGDLQDVYQQKRRALLQRSKRRVEGIKAKAGVPKVPAEIRAPSAGRQKPEAKDTRPGSCKANMKSEAPPHRAGTKPAGARAETSGVTRQKKNPPPPIVAESKLKRVDEVKICSTEQRKKNLAEMHQRTQRLYEQLDEVKHQKALKSRQEDYAKNRLKAKEFHKKTLQKLHAKQTRL